MEHFYFMFFWLVIHSCLLFVAPTPKLNDLPLDKVIDKLEQRYRSVSDFSADFEQTIVRANTKVGKSRSEMGRVFLKNPAMMRWDYQKPTTKFFIFNGQTLWFYKPEDAQVNIFKQFDQTEISAGLMFLVGKIKLKEKFTIQFHHVDNSSTHFIPTYAISLRPKVQDPQTQELLFLIDSEFFIKQVVLIQQMGQKNIFEFKNIKTNQDLKSDFFEFVPPENVKINHMN